MAVEYRLKPGDLNFICAMGADNSQWYARTAYPLKDCLNPMFFMNVKASLRAGDIVHLTRFSNDKWQQTIEWCYFLTVVAVDQMGVEFHKTFEIHTLNKPDEAGVVTVDRGFAGAFVVRIDGMTKETRNTLVEAHEVAEQLAAEHGKEFKPYTPKTKKAA